MKIYKTKINDLLIIKQKNNVDKRGSLRETYNKKFFNNKKFIFEYCTTSKKNVARGFHFQTKFFSFNIFLLNISLRLPLLSTLFFCLIINKSFIFVL